MLFGIWSKRDKNGNTLKGDNMLCKLRGRALNCHSLPYSMGGTLDCGLPFEAFIPGDNENLRELLKGEKWSI
jgi:hypothetical protein